MEIDRLTHGSMAAMFKACDTGLHDEIEAVYAGELLDRAAVQRLLEYLRSTGARRLKGNDVTTSTSLDIAVDLPDRLGPVRVTLVGEKIIQNALLATGGVGGVGDVGDVSWSSATVMHKRRLRPSVDVYEHRFRVNMKREEPVADAAELKVAVTLAASVEHGTRKVYRLKRRFSFPSADPMFIYDVTAVRQLTHSSPTWEELSAVPEKFEVECEYVSGTAKPKQDNEKEDEKRAASLASALLKCFGTILKVLDDTDRLMTVSQRNAVLTEYLTLMYPSDKATWTAQVGAGTLNHRYLPGPKPVTLEFQHLIEHGGLGKKHGSGKSKSRSKVSNPCEDEIEQDSRGSVSIVGGVPYTVTEKADGAHRVLFVNSRGGAYTLAVDGVIKVRDTGLACKAGGRGTMSILDGEFIGANSSTGSLFAAYDAFYFEGTDVRRLELMRDDEETKSSRMAVQPEGDGSKTQRSRPAPLSRLAACQMVSSSLSQPVEASAATTRVMVKKFMRYDGDMDGLTSCVRKVLARRDAKNFPYSIDGIIFTPAAWPMGALAMGGAVQSDAVTWLATMKWKPPDQNSIDFLVRILPGELVRRNNQSFRVAHLYVGYSPLTWDPVTTLSLLTDSATPYPKRGASVYIERLFGIPGEPPEKGGLHICHLLVEDGERIVCSSGEAVIDATIVEFTYDMTAGPDVPSSFRWIPLRPRPDKTQRFMMSGGEIGGAANDIKSAISVWMSIQAPITEDIMSGRVKPGLDTGAEQTVTAAYYLNKTRPGDGGMASMRDFHNWVKSTDLLLRAKGNTTRSLFDIGCGRAGDLHTWLKLGVTRVLGVDLSRPGIVEAENGGNVRIREMKKRGMGKHTPFPRIVLLPMDASRHIDAIQIDAMEDESDRQVARVVWSLIDASAVKDERLRRYHGFAMGGFDVVSCQFAVHYFFKTVDTLRAFASNVARHIRRGGFFVGTCMDAHRVNEAFGGKPCIQGVAGGKVIWRIQRLYEKFEPSADFQGNTGLRIKVYVQTIGQAMDEFLVDYRLLRLVMAEVGLVPPDADQLLQLGLDSKDAPDGTCTFDASHARMKKEWEVSGKGAEGDKHVVSALAMSDDEKAFSFLNRWFIFVKSDRTSREFRRRD